MAVPFLIPTRDVWEVLLPHILFSIRCQCSGFWPTGRCAVLRCGRCNLCFLHDMMRHMFYYAFFPICISSLAKHLRRPFVHFLTGLFIFLLLTSNNSLCILDYSSLSDMSFVSVSFQSVVCLINLLVHSSAELKFFMLSPAYQLIFLFCFLKVIAIPKVI